MNHFVIDNNSIEGLQITQHQPVGYERLFCIDELKDLVENRSIIQTNHQTFREVCQLIYLHNTAHAPDCEAGLNAHDPCLAISWAISIAERSTRNQHHATLIFDYLGLLI
jgi:hypothetical protein